MTNVLPRHHDEPATERAERTAPTPARAAVVGAVAAGAALAAGELVTGLADSTPSLVTAVGSEFIDRFAASLKDLAVALFGTNDKVALVVGIVITSVLLGAITGLATRTNRRAAPLAFGAFGLLGAWALWSDPQGGAGVAVVASAIAVAVGLGTFAGLWRLARPAPAAAASPPTTPMTTRRVVDRRGFVLGVSGAVIGTGVLAASGRRLRSTARVESARRTIVLPRPVASTPLPGAQPFAIDGLTPYVTPVADFYRIDTALATPQVAVDGWRLAVTGLVDRPLELTYDELLALDSVEEVVTIQCVSNEVGGNLVGNAVWQGVPLASVLERAGVRPDATQIVGRSVDGWTAGFPTAHAFDGRTALVAFAMNGEPLTADHGFPARLVVSGLYGYVSATKWLSEIELTTWEAFDGYWIPRGWAKEGPIKIASRIDVPRSRAGLAAGAQPIAGVAWAPDTGIERVEVQVDDGPWQACELGRTASDDTWVQWRLVWDASPGEHVIRVRATDRAGVVQTSERAAPAPDGATGWHERRVDVA